MKIHPKFNKDVDGKLLNELAHCQTFEVALCKMPYNWLGDSNLELLWQNCVAFGELFLTPIPPQRFDGFGNRVKPL